MWLAWHGVLCKTGDGNSYGLHKISCDRRRLFRSRCPSGLAQSPYESSADFAKYAMKLRAQALLKVEPQVFVPDHFAFFHLSLSLED